MKQVLFATHYVMCLMLSPDEASCGPKECDALQCEYLCHPEERNCLCQPGYSLLSNNIS